MWENPVRSVRTTLETVLITRPRFLVYENEADHTGHCKSRAGPNVDSGIAFEMGALQPAANTHANTKLECSDANTGEFATR